jgi:hypothetical protein
VNVPAWTVVIGYGLTCMALGAIGGWVIGGLIRRGRD